MRYVQGQSSSAWPIKVCASHSSETGGIHTSAYQEQAQYFGLVLGRPTHTSMAPGDKAVMISIGLEDVHFALAIMLLRGEIIQIRQSPEGKGKSPDSNDTQ